jgi:hypothetical protein
MLPRSWCGAATRAWRQQPLLPLLAAQTLARCLASHPGLSRPPPPPPPPPPTVTPSSPSPPSSSRLDPVLLAVRVLREARGTAYGSSGLPPGLLMSKVKDLFEGLGGASDKTNRTREQLSAASASSLVRYYPALFRAEYAVARCGDGEADDYFKTLHKVALTRHVVGGGGGGEQGAGGLAEQGSGHTVDSHGAWSAGPRRGGVADPSSTAASSSSSSSSSAPPSSPFTIDESRLRRTADLDPAEWGPLVEGVLEEAGGFLPVGVFAERVQLTALRRGLALPSEAGFAWCVMSPDPMFARIRPVWSHLLVDGDFPEVAGVQLVPEGCGTAVEWDLRELAEAAGRKGGGRAGGGGGAEAVGGKGLAVQQ